MIRQRNPIKRSPLKSRTKFLPRSTKRIRQVNPVAKAKRDKRNAKDRRSPHMREIRKQAMERAGGQCEAHYHKILPTGAYESIVPYRCEARERLELHHLRYPRVRKLAVNDVQMLCKAHHDLAEARKLHKWNRRSAA